jgi:hypothetical protein
LENLSEVNKLGGGGGYEILASTGSSICLAMNGSYEWEEERMSRFENCATDE